MPAEIAYASRFWHNPYHKPGMHAERRLVRALDIRKELSQLDSKAQFILQAQAAGCNQRETARLCGVSERTMVRWMAVFTALRRAA